MAKRRKKGDITKLKNRCDLLCRLLTVTDQKCLRCGKETNLQDSHIVSRKYQSTRWNLDNHIPLCVGCHLFWWHKEPTEAYPWIREKIGEAGINRLLALAKKHVEMPKEYLEKLVRELEIKCDKKNISLSK